MKMKARAVRSGEPTYTLSELRLLGKDKTRATIITIIIIIMLAFRQYSVPGIQQKMSFRYKPNILP